MFRTLVARQAQHAIDMKAWKLVKPDISFYRPGIADKGEHTPPDDHPLWNESWYFDAITPDGEVGIYARIGRLPNQGCCNVIAGVFRKKEKPVLLADMHATLPPSDSTAQKIRTERFEAESRCLEPLGSFSLKLIGTGTMLGDPASPLHGELTGTDVPDIDVDLVWETSASPYKKRSQTLYEIPCRVSGTITLGCGQVYHLDSAPGGRNHSWGIRDWWKTDWCWSGLHFEDGTDIFIIALGGGENSTGAAGFIQKDGELTEITEGVNEFEWREDGLPGDLKLRIQPGDRMVECQAIAEAGLRLEDAEGRVAHLARVMCRATLDGEEKGVGWLDFNRVVKKEGTGLKLL
jgi:hypothetical protein